MSNNGQVPPPPRTQAERELEKLQRMVTEGQLADERRRKLIIELHREGMTQVEIAARLTRASKRAGGPPVGLDAVNKLWKRYRSRL